MRMGQGVRTGLGHGGITCVLQTQFSIFFFFFFFYSRSGWESLAGYYRSRMQKGTSFAQNLIKVYVFYTHI